MSNYKNAASVHDLRRQAKKRLPKMVFEFIEGGAGDEVTLRENESSFYKWKLNSRVCIDVSERKFSTSILGFEASLPVIIAPTGLAGLFRPKGELLFAKAAASLGIPFCLSTNSVASIEQVALAAGPSERWFQIYMLKDKALMYSMLDRAKGSGYRTLCITVDLATQGRRDRDIRNAFSVPFRPRLKNCLDIASKPGWVYGALRNPVRFGNFPTQNEDNLTSVAQFVASLFDPGASWEDVEQLVNYWDGPTVIKGILRPDDALNAINAGANAIVVSNHGGRQLDQVDASVAALPAISEAINGKCEIILDGGVRRGLDIIKAKALGATACMVGRPFLWGLVGGGQEGVEKVGNLFEEELDNAMALLGVVDFSSIGGECITKR